MKKEHIAASHYNTRSASDVLFMLDNAELELAYAKRRFGNEKATYDYRLRLDGHGGEITNHVIEADRAIAVLKEKVLILKWMVNINERSGRDQNFNAIPTEAEKLELLYREREALTDDFFRVTEKLRTEEEKSYIEFYIKELSRIVADTKVVCEKIGKLQQLTIKG